VTLLSTRFPPATADVHDLTVAWREAAEDARLAYRAWCEAGRSTARDAYVVFAAAADREAVAADCVSRLARKVLTGERARA
jgi:hypothetical protein